ncbi:MAG TPA: tetratricopeptide repeat protein [Acidobacteriota bacterium]|jgi:tetratricopeptide (TPR) repeat protein
MTRSSSLLTFAAFFLLANAGCGNRISKVTRVTVAPDQLTRASAIIREADGLMARGETYAALIKYLDAAKLNPNSEIVFNKIAISYTKLNYYDRATEAAIRSLGLNPKYPFGYNTLGTIQLVQHKAGAAIRNFRRAIGLNGKVAFFYLNLGNAYLEQKNSDKAMKAFHEALTIDPDVMNRQAGVGVQAASAQFNDARRNYFMARVFAERGQDLLALELLKRALSGGFTDVERIMKDKEFNRLRGTKEFKDLLEEYGLAAKTAKS